MTAKASATSRPLRGALRRPLRQGGGPVGLSLDLVPITLKRAPGRAVESITTCGARHNLRHTVMSDPDASK
eukprot:CAMPEP_0204208296 /NCGR_PEP_ID=MMETSP0361-20130328/72393_1 /ASSEMBLY_ACC=CAM_ASM_000343 /TAXON_ID=268821 /ORGANISM="Scrippsiella Hangoei, Strain SHTV-5" /LENGTH=70 /DNA_ID=CAMNT_0051172063 /DNA_START=275 /DNA_END=485 /DNA_ORIENTATION=-